MILTRLIAAIALCMTAAGCGSGTKPAPAAATTAPSPSTPSASAAVMKAAEVVAHRGGVPENTLAAFTKALADPDVGAIELDVQVSKDGQLFIMHDTSVDRTTNGKGQIRDLTAAQLRELKTPKDGGEPVPTLDEVLAKVAAAPGKRVFVEIKEPVPADTPAKVLAAIKQHGVADRAIVTSFDQSLLDPARKLEPGQAVGFISKSFGTNELNYPSQYLLITSGAVTPGWLEDAHKAGKQVYVWTVDEPREMERFLRMGVDGLISNEYRKAAETRASLSH